MRGFDTLLYLVYVLRWVALRLHESRFLTWTLYSKVLEQISVYLWFHVWTLYRRVLEQAVIYLRFQTWTLYTVGHGSRLAFTYVYLHGHFTVGHWSRLVFSYDFRHGHYTVGHWSRVVFTYDFWHRHYTVGHWSRLVFLLYIFIHTYIYIYKRLTHKQNMNFTYLLSICFEHVLSSDVYVKLLYIYKIHISFFQCFYLFWFFSLIFILHF